MKTFYSIVQIAPNIATSDSIAIGVILFDGISFRYFFSESKKKIAVKMLKEHVNIDFLVNQIESKCQEFNQEASDNKLIYNSVDFSNPSYFEYLNRYSNGLLQFSRPNRIEEQNFETIGFSKLIKYLFDEDPFRTVEVSIPNYSRSVVEEKLIDKVKEKVHTHYKFMESSVQGLYFNFELECIGLNGALIGAKYIDFSKTVTTLDTTISHYFTLISSLSLEYNKDLQKNDFFLLSEEPSDIDSREHKIWESVNNSPMVTVLPPEESDKVAELIFDKKASTFL